MPITKEMGCDVSPGNHTGVLGTPRIEAYPVTKKKGGKTVEEEAAYLKIPVKTDGCESILEASWPANLSDSSALGRLLDRFGISLEVGESFDESVLEGIEAAYSVKPDGQFVRIDQESVRPRPTA